MSNQKDIESIYNLYVNDLFTYASYLGFKKEIVMDAIHDVFCKLASEKQRLDSIENVKFYLFRSLKNRLYDIHKTKKTYISLSEKEDIDEYPFNISVTIEDDIINFEEQSSIKQRIEDMLTSLTSKQREILYLRFVQEYEYQDIAELLNISINGCRKLVSKAIASLREKYGSVSILLLLLNL